MTRGVDYDLPHHRAAVAKCAKQLQDLDRREGEYRRGATAARDAFVAACADLGVAPEARSRPGGFAAAVATLTDGLDDVFRDAAAARARGTRRRGGRALHGVDRVGARTRRDRRGTPPVPRETFSVRG